MWECVCLAPYCRSELEAINISIQLEESKKNSPQCLKILSHGPVVFHRFDETIHLGSVIILSTKIVFSSWKQLAMLTKFEICVSSSVAFPENISIGKCIAPTWMVGTWVPFSSDPGLITWEALVSCLARAKSFLSLYFFGSYGLSYGFHSLFISFLVTCSCFHVSNSVVIYPPNDWSISSIDFRASIKAVRCLIKSTIFQSWDYAMPLLFKITLQSIKYISRTCIVLRKKIWRNVNVLKSEGLLWQESEYC